MLRYPPGPIIEYEIKRMPKLKHRCSHSQENSHVANSDLHKEKLVEWKPPDIHLTVKLCRVQEIVNHNNRRDSDWESDEAIEYHYEEFAVLLSHIDDAKTNCYQALDENQNADGLDDVGLCLVNLISLSRLAEVWRN